MQVYEESCIWLLSVTYRGEKCGWVVVSSVYDGLWRHHTPWCHRVHLHPLSAGTYHHHSHRYVLNHGSVHESCYETTIIFCISTPQFVYMYLMHAQWCHSDRRPLDGATIPGTPHPHYMDHWIHPLVMIYEMWTLRKLPWKSHVKKQSTLSRKPLGKVKNESVFSQNN